MNSVPHIPPFFFSRIAFFASHGGSSMQEIVRACEDGRLHATPVLVISNNPDSVALAFAREHGIPALALNAKSCGSPQAVEMEIVKALEASSADLIVLSGYMKLLGQEVVRRFPGRILNIHPALLPKFGGKGMYGMNVHRAVLESGEPETGITIHVVNERYDEGPIIAQMKVPVLAGDTAESLAERVKAQEPRFLVQTLIQMLGLAKNI